MINSNPNKSIQPIKENSKKSIDEPYMSMDDIDNGEYETISVDENLENKIPYNVKNVRTPEVRPEELTKKQNIKLSTGYSKKFQENEYTIPKSNDYYNPKSGKYYELGGLGPLTVGTEEWNRRKEMQDRRNLYAKHVNTANANSLPPAKPKKVVEKEKSSREKAIEFAKNVPKPIPKPKVVAKEETKEYSPIKPSSLLIEQLEKHELYKAKIQEIKAQFYM
ncbi:unnamed protein product [Blepharisma stoltei]|uniref:Uncharacterized protein n=1 Tax=Blepharisma stoltei TaxID=1481888 RepID=A0AAU9JB49_9CILI|nr:unnamed protein product [Blepharisma stoltei]